MMGSKKTDRKGGGWCELDVLINTQWWMWQVEQRDWWGTTALPPVTALLFSLSCFHSPFGAPHQPGRGSCTSLSHALQTAEFNPPPQPDPVLSFDKPQKTHTHLPLPSFFFQHERSNNPQSNSICTQTRTQTHFHLTGPSFYFSNWSYEDRTKLTT